MAKSNRVLEIALAAALFAGCAGAVMAQDAAASVGNRRAAMKAIGGASAALRNPASDAAALAGAGKTINENLKTFGANLAAGSGPESGQATKAKAEIWSDGAGFKAAMDAALAASDTLAHATDIDGAKAAAGDMGKACGGCHSKYRAA
jgi:cytochrome c556